MTYWIRYFRAGRDDAGVLIIPTEEDFAAHKARLEASGYVVHVVLDPVASSRPDVLPHKRRATIADPPEAHV